MIIFNYLVFPGFLFAIIIGLLTVWYDRKITARVQWRVGPPWYQGFADILKLFAKETFIPATAKRTGFVLAPFIGFSTALLVAAMLGVAGMYPKMSFTGDIIVLWYLLMIPSIAIIFGSSASGNPISQVGSSREMKLFMSYELPFVIILFSIAAKAHSLSIGGIIEYQRANGANLWSLSGVIGFVVAIISTQAKLGLVPFDIPEAEGELASGIMLEYSGSLLAIFKLMKALLLYTLPLFLITVFLGGMNLQGFGILWFIIEYLLIVFIISLIRNTNPRLRIDQAMNLFWEILTPLAILSGILSYVGL